MKKTRLLLVDDDDRLQAGARRYFETAGYDVDCAYEKEEAEALVSHRRYDCVVVDLRLTAGHGADGLEVIDCVRLNHPATRIVVLTGCGAAPTEAEALRLGADAFLQKPQPLSKLRAAVADLIGADE